MWERNKIASIGGGLLLALVLINSATACDVAFEENPGIPRFASIPGSDEGNYQDFLTIRMRLWTEPVYLKFQLEGRDGEFTAARVLRFDSCGNPRRTESMVSFPLQSPLEAGVRSFSGRFQDRDISLRFSNGVANVFISGLKNYFSARYDDRGVILTDLNSGSDSHSRAVSFGGWDKAHWKFKDNNGAIHAFNADQNFPDIRPRQPSHPPHSSRG